MSLQFSTFGCRVPHVTDAFICHLHTYTYIYIYRKIYASRLSVNIPELTDFLTSGSRDASCVCAYAYVCICMHAVRKHFYWQNVQLWYVWLQPISCSGCSSCATFYKMLGFISDNSGTDSATASNADCTWIIAPVGAQNITLTMLEFRTR
jgi:hypothetical protein